MRSQEIGLEPSFKSSERSRALRFETESFVSRIRRVERLIQSASKKCDEHHYSEAAALLAPLSNDVPGPLAGPFFEVLGRCALHGCAEDWVASFGRALSSYEETGDRIGTARVLLYRGEAEAARGDFLAATQALAQASRVFRSETEFVGAADTAVALARIALFQNRLEPAEERASWAIVQYQAAKSVTREIVARLLRAQIYASCGQGPKAARDLLFSERLAEQTEQQAPLRVALARAESLLWLGYPYRALSLLKPLAPDVKERDELAATAHYLRLCGQAEKEFKPKFAHYRLSEAAGLFGRLGQRYYHAECELGLGIALQRQGQSASAHWASLERTNLSRWPVLEHLYANARRQGATAPSAFAQQATERQPIVTEPENVEAVLHSPPGLAIFKKLGSLLESFVAFLAGGTDGVVPENRVLARPEPAEEKMRFAPQKPQLAALYPSRQERIREKVIEQTAH